MSPAPAGRRPTSAPLAHHPARTHSAPSAASGDLHRGATVRLAAAHRPLRVPPSPRAGRGIGRCDGADDGRTEPRELWAAGILCAVDARSWRRLIGQEVLPHLPELVLTRSILHSPDTEWLLCAALKNDSAFSKGFTVEVIVMPLYEPTGHIGWLVGERLGNLTEGHDIWWDPDRQSTSAIGSDIAARLRRGAIPFWAKYGDLQSLAIGCASRPTFAVDVHYLEWVAGAGVISGEDALARRAFSAARQLRPELQWEEVAKARIEQLAKLWSTDPEAARHVLRANRDHTAAAIGLE